MLLFWKPWRLMGGSKFAERTTYTLPQALTDAIPTCAQKCVATSIESTFNQTCTSTSTKLDCLCSQYNTQGLTLGEVSYVCLASDCSNATTSEATKVYDVCDDQSGAASATHTVLTSFETATAASDASMTISTSSSSTTSKETSTTVTSGTSTAKSTTLSTFSTSTLSTSTISSITTSATTSSSPSATFVLNATTSAVPSNQTSSTLTSGQAVGVSLGALGGLGMLVALFFCCCCCIRRKKVKEEEKKEKEKSKKYRHSFDFVDKSPGPNSPFSPYMFVVRAPEGVRRVERTKRDDHDCTQSCISCEPPPEQNGLRIAMTRPEAPPPVHHPITEWSGFGAIVTRPNPFGSGKQMEKTTARRPVTQWPGTVAPLAESTETEVERKTRTPPSRPKRPASNATVKTVFEEDGKSPHLEHLPEVPALYRKAYSSPPPSPAVYPRFAEGHHPPCEAEQHRALYLEIPVASSQANHETTLHSPEQMAASNSPSMFKTKSGHFSIPPNSAASYIPAYYTSNDSRTPVIPGFSSQRFSHPQLPARPLPKGFRMSYASDTTFESVDPDEETPQEEAEKRLSAVAESPISGLRYPKVPRPSNQAVPRISPRSAWTASSTGFSPISEDNQPSMRGNGSPFDEKPPTLLTKRRGENATMELGQRLQITSYAGSASIYSQASQGASLTHLPLQADQSKEWTGSPPRRGARRDAKADGSEMQTCTMTETPLKSPFWEPKLTPSKRGDDLFISVH